MKTTLIFGLLLIGTQTWAQDNIWLKNPSFEADLAATGVVPKDWLDMGAEKETPPDIQPGMFGVTLPAQNGRTYVGLVVRDNNTWEGIGQHLSASLQKGLVYSFSIYLAHSEDLSSPTKRSPEHMPYDGQTILKIWGYNEATQQEEVLAESVPVTHAQWRKYTFTLQPQSGDFNELDLTAYYAPGFEQQNGNLLLDNCSEIIKVSK